MVMGINATSGGGFVEDCCTKKGRFRQGAKEKLRKRKEGRVFWGGVKKRMSKETQAKKAAEAELRGEVANALKIRRHLRTGGKQCANTPLGVGRFTKKHAKSEATKVKWVL